MTANSSIEAGRQKGIRAARWPWVFAVMVFGLGVSLSLYVWRVLRRIEQSAIEEDFRAQAGALAQRVAREVKMIEDVLDSISHLHTLSERISREDFVEFVEKGMRFQRDVLGAFGFVQQIDEETRLYLEIAETNALRIVQRAEMNSAQFSGVPLRGIYYPLMYQYPENGLGLPLGFDFASDPVYAQGVKTMLEKGMAVVGGPAPDVEEGDRIFIFSPIIYMLLVDGDSQPLGQSVVGFTVALFAPREVIARALGGERTLLEKADWRVKWGMRRDASSGDGAGEMGQRLVYDTAIPLADMQWPIRFTADRDGFAPAGRRISTTALSIGLGITLVVSAELLMLAGRARRIEKLVEARTSALRAAKEQLEKEMRRRSELESEILSISTREKVRVGQDLHDSLGQKLTGAALLSGALARRVSDEVRPEVQNLHELLKESISQLRRMAKGLAPVDLGERGLVGALEQLVEETQETADGVLCEFRCVGHVPSISGKKAEHLYHIAQEAVTNALRHAGAHTINITLSVHGEDGELTVQDDGCGIDANRTNRDGLGLEIMQHRADLIFGSLKVESAIKKGTKIICRFPV